ncbi:MAG: XTP/dITP diphosphatase [Lentisphaeria bacterium]|nr:XTP/dITP diphosphatase [Lentisphaeria bacterium]
MLQLLAATSNKNKIREFQEMFSEAGNNVLIVSPATFGGLPDIVEDGTTFEENSAIKAQKASHYADMAAFADDSGLEVDALNGEPGINSARYAGPDATDADRIAKLLENLKGKTNRKARFVCVISLAYRGNLVAQFRGEVSGTITDAPKGSNGFGYDPVFIPDGYDKTFAELGPEVKDAISHRGKAFALAAEFVKQELSTMDDFEFV